MSRKIIIAGVGLVALAGVAVAGVMYGPWSTRAGRSGASHAKESQVPVKVAYVDVKELTLRLADTSAEHYIRMNPVLAVPAGHEEKVEERIPLVRDRIVTIVSGETSTTLATPQGEQRLKSDLIGALHKDFGDEVVDVYFSGYLVE